MLIAQYGNHSVERQHTLGIVHFEFNKYSGLEDFAEMSWQIAFVWDMTFRH
jgi:hypothetical protein